MGYGNCNGCGVCTLSCPAWQQGHDALMTFMGRARALQRGAEFSELRDSVNSCLLCGSCEPVCAMGIPTVDITLGLRAILAGENVDWWRKLQNIPEASGRRSALLPGPALRRNEKLLDRLSGILETQVAPDDGTDVLDAFERGIVPDIDRANAFMKSLVGISRLVSTEGLMKRFLRSILPQIEVIGMGEALLRVPHIRASLQPTDLYIIEARAYNADFKRCAPFYTEVSRQTGCAMNMDLQRVAIPTGTCSRRDANCNMAPIIAEQIRWIIEGMSFKRIVVEAVEDIAILEEAAGVSVVHVAELLEVAAA